MFNKIFVIVCFLVGAGACSRPVDEVTDFYFTLGESESMTFERAMAEMDQAALDEERLLSEIWDLPPITGQLEQDEEIVAKLHDLVLDGLTLEENSTNTFLKIIDIQQQAYLQHEGEGKLLHPRYERDLIRMKDQCALQHLRSVNREYAELRKKLGYQLLKNDAPASQQKVSKEFFFSLDVEAERTVRQLVFEIRQTAEENKNLADQIRELPSRSQDEQQNAETLETLYRLVMQGTRLEEQVASAFLEAVGVQKAAYLLQAEGDGNKKLLTPEQEQLFISMKNDTIDSYIRSGNREFEELMKKLGLAL